MNEVELQKQNEVFRTGEIIRIKKRIMGLQMNEHRFIKDTDKELYKKTLSELQTTLKNLTDEGVK